MKTTYTDRDATDYVTSAIEAGGGATREEFDIEAIVAELKDLNDGGLNFDGIADGPFWEVVRKHAKD